ncbi:MAG: hypothetical protein Q9191_004569 [Dirinaria sp. TL-2023a]
MPACPDSSLSTSTSPSNSDLLSEYWDVQNSSRYSSFFSLREELATMTAELCAIKTDLRSTYIWTIDEWTTMKTFQQQLTHDRHLYRRKLAALDAEIARYLRNMQLLYAEFVIRVSRIQDDADARRQGLTNQVSFSAAQLRRFLFDCRVYKLQQPNEDYLTEIFRFWRRFGAKNDHAPFEDVWEFVAGRKLRWE